MMRWIALGVLACGFLTPATLPAQGKWKREVRAPPRRTEVAVAVRGGEIFVIGGLTHRGVSRLVEVYHPRKRRWRSQIPSSEHRHWTVYVQVSCSEPPVRWIGSPPN